MSEGYDKPSEMTYRHYREHVETAGETALNAYIEWHEDYPELHEAVEYAIEGDRLVHNYGYMLMTVLLSDQSPESPEYCERWSAYVDLCADPTWSDCVSQMAYVCYYSDVMDWVKRALEDDE